MWKSKTEQESTQLCMTKAAVSAWLALRQCFDCSGITPTASPSQVGASLCCFSLLLLQEEANTHIQSAHISHAQTDEMDNIMHFNGR